MDLYILAKDLKHKFQVYGHFYDLDIGASKAQPCRSVIEIVTAKTPLSDALTYKLPDALVIMMNPGSSSPEENIERKVYDKTTISDLKPSLCKARPDATQYQIMRLMAAMDWNHVRVINLSDLRVSNSNEFYKKIKDLDTDLHSIFSDSRKTELESKLEGMKKAPIICAWGMDKALESFSENVESALAKYPCIGWKKDNHNFKFYHANPQTWERKQMWLAKILFQLRLPDRITINDINELHSYWKDFDIMYTLQINASTEVEEWFYLINFIKKSLFLEEARDFFNYPFTLIKQERPDFKIEFGNKDPFYVEITRITTEMYEASKNAFRKNEKKCVIEISSKTVSSAKPSKGKAQEHIKEYVENVFEKRLILEEDPIFGDEVEVGWARRVVETIKKKSNKKYAARTDLLFLDDDHWRFSSKQYISKRFEKLKSLIEKHVNQSDLDAFPNIISLGQNFIGLIRKDGNWLFKLIPFPEE